MRPWPLDPWCLSLFYFYFNQPWVLEALGVHLNFTFESIPLLNVYGFDAIGEVFRTGDDLRRSMSDFEYLLQNGVKVAMAYGDRDYRCNWMGGEAVALAAQWEGKESFNARGWEKLVTNKAYDGGLVKQFGSLSFSRVFEAGHSVSAYQPETVYRIFMRAMKYSSTGPVSSLAIENVDPKLQLACVVDGVYPEGDAAAVSITSCEVKGRPLTC
jgi:hypothetical protein